MSKDLTKSNKQPMAMQAGAVSMEARAASPNMHGSAIAMPGKNNAKRAAQKHMGELPMKNENGYT